MAFPLGATQLGKRYGKQHWLTDCRCDRDSEANIGAAALGSQG